MLSICEFPLYEKCFFRNMSQTITILSHIYLKYYISKKSTGSFFFTPVLSSFLSKKENSDDKNNIHLSKEALQDSFMYVSFFGQKWNGELIQLTNNIIVALLYFSICCNRKT